ncbi:hypothetical protein [Salipiger aestuarii]|uniref:hypothetical protein n=1 Tax=Salipiger aestuarii TaxID=568098 RepID=UPI00123BBE9E|nr:hypothetical protein [Salipiger aestuarii]KAA8609012.1 hypothetical protein AL037_15905 [Salipiger aestuarii]
MRILATLCTLAALTAAILAGAQLWQQVARWQADAAPALAPANAPALPAPPPPAPPARWPAIFGEPHPPAPPEPPAAEPQPPGAPKPPLDSLGYRLRGVVRSHDKLWALVSHPTGETLVRAGDVIAPGIRALRIAAEGLYISRDEDAPELLAFPQ